MPCTTSSVLATQRPFGQGRRRVAEAQRVLAPSHTATVWSPSSAPDVFAFLADLSNLADWHPAVAESRETTSGAPARLGARFPVVLGDGARTQDRTLEVIDIIDDRSLVLQTEGHGMVVTDSIDLAPTGGGCLVRCRAHVRLRGLHLVRAPLVHRSLRRAGTHVRERLGTLLAP